MSVNDNLVMCPRCKVLVSDLGKHQRRGRCSEQHIRHTRDVSGRIKKR